MWGIITSIVLVIASLDVICITIYKKFVFDKEKDELNAEIVSKARENRELLIEIDDLKSIRKALYKDSTKLLEVNEKQRKILVEVADTSVRYLVEHEKEALSKIRELTRDYQSDISSKLINTNIIAK